MTRQEYVNGGDNMIIDGQETVSPEKKNVDVIPDGFNANYLKVYYYLFMFSTTVVSFYCSKALWSLHFK